MFDEGFPGFAEAVDIAVVAVPLVGEEFHGVVLEIPPAIAQHAEEDAGFSLLRDQGEQGFVAAGSHIEITIRSQDDAVHAVFDEV